MRYSILLLLSTFLLVASCSKDDEPAATGETKATRAVMIYMAGENDLTENLRNTRFLDNDLKEMIEGSKLLDDNQRLFVFVDSLDNAPVTTYYNTLSEEDRASLQDEMDMEDVIMFMKDLEEEKLAKGTPFILELHDGEAKLMKQYDDDFYSSDPDMFADVISWMTDNVKADGYGLVLWGHATGWIVHSDSVSNSTTRAYGLDEGLRLGGDYKWMNITQMARALTKIPKFDFIFADCCQMMCAEVGYELRDATDYLIGSPAEVPSEGFPYDKNLPELFKNGSNLYRGIIDSYYDYFYNKYKDTQDRYAGYSVPMSVIDTRYIESLAVATRDILSRFSGGYPSKPENPSLEGTVFYNYSYDEPLMYDMRAVIKQHTSDVDFQNWDKVYQQAVPYYRMSMKWKTTFTNLITEFNNFNQNPSINGCVSMFIPRNLPSYTTEHEKYNQTAANLEWNRIMDWSRFGW